MKVVYIENTEIIPKPGNVYKSLYTETYFIVVQVYEITNQIFGIWFDHEGSCTGGTRFNKDTPLFKCDPIGYCDTFAKTIEIGLFGNKS